MDHIAAFNRLSVPRGALGLLWLGQAGFLVKDAAGRRLAVDPYLSDCVERLSGFKRLTPPVAAPEELRPDVCLCTHSHDDHLDVDAAPLLLRDPRTVLLGPCSVTALGRELGIPAAQLVEVGAGDVRQLGDYRITAVYADHGALEPHAVGFVVQNGGVTLYFTGDTAYRPREMAAAFALHPDVIILPINGEFGNLDAREAAMTARDSGARQAIPSHFWTLAVHRGDPYAFGEELARLAPGCEARFLCQGECCLCRAAEQEGGGADDGAGSL